MHDFWHMRVPPSTEEQPFWIRRTSLPAVECSVCGEVWGVQNRLPQQIPQQVNRKLKGITGPVALDRFRSLRQFLADSAQLAVDAALLEPGVTVGAARVVRYPSGVSPRLHSFGGSLFLSETSAQVLRPFDGAGLYLFPCCPPYENLMEVVPAPCPRHRLFPGVSCVGCGSRDESRVDKQFIENAVRELDSAAGHMLSLPGMLLVTEGVKHALESVVSPPVTFEHMTLPSLVGRITAG